jgi:Ca2+-binding RTX toxin-like protein
VDAGEQIVEQVGGGTDRIRIDGITDFTAMADANFDEIEQLELTGGVTATFNGSQVDFETLDLFDGGAGGNEIIINAPGGGLFLQGIVPDSSWSNGVGNKVSVVGTAGHDNVQGTQAADSISGDAADDHLEGNGGNDTLIGGLGNDTLIGGQGADTFVFAVGDSGTISGTVFDIITDYGVGGDDDLLDLAGVATVAANTVLDVDVSAAVAGGGVVDAAVLNGVISLSGVDSLLIDTLDEWIAVARIVVTGLGEAATFEFDGSTYVYQNNGGGAGDLLVKLDNVTGVTSLSTGAQAPDRVRIG